MMESIQLAQMLADLSDLNAAVGGISTSPLDLSPARLLPDTSNIF